MKETRKSTAIREEQSGEKPRARRVGESTDELERKMQSALKEVYEVLLEAGGETNGIAWAEFELVSDLIH